jgi:hypothetical protein
MRATAIGVWAYAFLMIAASSVAGQAQLPAAEHAHVADILSPNLPADGDSDKVIAGLSRTSRPELLTWERIYALALVRARSGRGSFVETLDLSALTQESARLGIAEFARFRGDFLTGRTADGVAFHDPSAQVLGLLARLQVIDSARRNVVVHENLRRMLVDRVQSESSGVNRLDLDLVFASLVRTRQELEGMIRQYRDGLDELKVMLGLSPRAVVILDRQSLTAFGAVFDAVEGWASSPFRRVHVLYELLEQLPALGEVFVDGQPILTQIETNPDRWEEVLANAARLAIKNRSEQEAQVPASSGIQLELRVRQRIRKLVETEGAYEAAKRSYELAVRLQDQALERLLAPPTAGITSRSPLLKALIEQITTVAKTQEQLATLWTSFRAERMSLYRDLGTLPYDDWRSLYADFSTGTIAAQAVPAGPHDPAVGNAPVPPAPAAPPRPLPPAPMAPPRP